MQLSQELSSGNIQSTSPRKKFNIYLLICLIVVLVITIPVIIVLAVKLSDKSDDFNSLQENYNKLDNDKKSLDEQFNSLKNNYNSLQDDYKELNDTKTNLDKELKDATEENEKLRNELETEKAENDKLRNNNTDLDNQLNDLKDKYKELNNTKTDLDKELNDLKDKYEELNNTKTELDNELNDLKDKYEELNNTKTDLDNQLNDLKDKYEELNNTKTELENQYSNQNSTLNDRFNALQNFISIANIVNAQFSKDEYQNVKEKLELAMTFEDGTYAFNIAEVEAHAQATFTSTEHDPVSYPQGYQVAFETDSRNWENYYTDEEYDDIVYNLASLVGVEPNIDVKDYKSKISFHIEDLDTSLSIAALFNQEYIYNWANETYIPNGFYQP